jgi:L-ascorbate metabolism protein UlaG (beta-lactamase superfamily)
MAQVGKKEFTKEKKDQKTNVEVEKDGDFLKDKKDGFTWLGHATFYFTLNKKNFIIDPVLFNVGPIKRFTKLPCKEEKIDDLDFILLSHNHRDHMDKKSMQLLCKINPKAIIYTGLEIGKLLRKWNIKNEIVEAGWYQQYPSFKDIHITYLPAKHWNRRALRDLNEMLWGSFMIEYEGKHFYFGADSGLGIHFEYIGQLYPNIDYAFIGIGAYEPNWFMRTAHTNPEDALEALNMLGAEKFIPMHFGTFDLSDEPIYLPKETLQKVASKKEKDKIISINIGEKYFIKE